MQVDITFIGDFMDGPRYQAQPQALNSAYGGTPAETRAAFVEAWNEQTGDARTEDDFTFVQQGGVPEDQQRGDAPEDGE